MIRNILCWQYGRDSSTRLADPDARRPSFAIAPTPAAAATVFAARIAAALRRRGRHMPRLRWPAPRTRRQLRQPPLSPSMARGQRAPGAFACIVRGAYLGRTMQSGTRSEP